jgi:ATP-dependent exoDNAse (exonuclease V) beta subunit
MTPREAIVLPDQAERDRAQRDYEMSHLVEASAGTGKTSTLIQRILWMLKEGGRTLSEIAAMTFTEKAAGEMKTRLRAALDEAVGAETNADWRQALVQARREVESAEVSTIHSFCAGLLREQPVAAEVDPDFSATDATRAEALLTESFASWLDREARNAGGPVSRALEAGASPQGLLDLARVLLAERTLLDGTTLPSDPLAEAHAELDPLIELFETALEQVPAELRAHPWTEQSETALRELRRVRRLPIEELAAWSPEKVFNFSRGKRKVFAPDLEDLLKYGNESFRKLSGHFSTLLLEGLLAETVTSIRTGLLREIEEEKRRQGLLDFDDLLLKTRDLLRSKPAIRHYFHQRYKTLVVDEFQDTDPVQAEIVMRLSAAGPQDPVEWRDLAPDPGSLFIVGDPKQSIYRFRRADVESYREVRDRFDEEGRLALRTNFRSDPRLLAYVNAVLEKTMVENEDEPWEIGYAPLEPNPARPPSPLERPVLHLLPPEGPEAEAGEEPGPTSAQEGDGNEVGEAGAGEEEEEPALAAQEANAVANLLLRLHGRFPCESWRDVAVVVHRNEAIDRLQEVFRAAGIPAILEGGKSFYRREETTAVAVALKAIDDPGDSVSTVAALKSFLFGLTDLELLEAVEEGGRLDDWESLPPGGAAGKATSVLRRLHEKRHRRPFAETVGDLLSARLAFCAVEAGAVLNGVQGAANLERLLAMARDLDREGLSFRQATERLARKLDQNEGEPRAFAEEVDAVRLITIHKAKGLEFNVVVLADLGLRTKHLAPRLFYDRAGGEYGVSLKFGGSTVRTPGARRLLRAFEQRLRAEEKRFLYVGLTRAREMLAVSWFRKRGTTKKGEPTDAIAKTLLAPLAPFERPSAPLDAFVEVAFGDVQTPPAPSAAPPFEGPEGVEEQMAAAEELLERARSTAARPLRRAGEKPSDGIRIARPEDLPAAERDEERRSRAVRIGIAVHETMERLLSPERALPLDEALDASTRELLPEERSETARLVRRLAVDPIVARALAARRRFVELPILFRDDGIAGSPLVEGKIDLLFEEDDGWVIVDWKTDRLDSLATRALRESLYRPQLDAYGRGFRALLGPSVRVKASLLVFAREA